MKIHALANGVTVVHLSQHQFRFSDGTIAEPQDADVVSKFTLKKEFKVLREIRGMKVTRTAFVVDEQQMDELNKIAKSVDIVLVSFQMLQAIHDSGFHFNNVVAFNSTKETARSSPEEKIVDIDNWSGLR